ncbi:DDB1- and CUL4-associated factor 7 like protein [Tritrichomonas foetus]|uniref:DDB1- and CUL4-associated factor 7 like protein n=1 Tax=Tritrichomonas foetus TaxID=1144522 RepID=A0A1J4K5U4_9EUKA|nr:DDB1- and CUL4-associated factor 7 like protein [Tritrichomonas foetus]|eukprot:OHT05100.1 DDB1- and CUL4-associated factor 7 like protein [Tritrichomonas foetus]
MEIPKIELPYKPFAISLTSTLSPNEYLSVATFETSIPNQLDIFQYNSDSFIKLDSSDECKFSFPITSCKFAPNHSSDITEFLLTGAESVKLWSVVDNSIKLQSEYKINQTNNPITSIDWCPENRVLAIAASTDNSVSILDFVADCVSANILAHDNPIHDCAFCGDQNYFATAGYDGSLRLCDVRDLSSLTLVYQAAMPLLRISPSPIDSNLIALFGRSATGVTLVDIRSPGLPIAASTHVDKEVSGIAWSVENLGVLYSVNNAGQLRVCDFSSGKTMAPSSVIHETGEKNEAIAVTQGKVAIVYENCLDIGIINENDGLELLSEELSEELSEDLCEE